MSPPHAPASAEVERIIVATRVSRPLSQYGELERIRQSAVRRNQRDGIHAVLLYQSGWYVHWAEGPGEAIRAMLARVSEDNRHHSPHVVHHSRGERYLLSRWSMMLHPSTESAEDFGRRVAELFEARKRGIQFPPTSVMRRLSAPLRVTGQLPADHAQTFHRLGICSAEDGRCFEFVRWLASRPGAVGQPRRVAGEEGLDSSSDYAEFMFDEVPCRVTGVSRAGLMHGVRRVFLPDWTFLVLMLGDDAQRNTALMQRVVEACADLPASPRLLGVAAANGVHARMLVMAQAAGLKYRLLGSFDARDYAGIWGSIAERLRESGTPLSSQWDITHPNWVA